jgi:type I restriction enzyme M protein
MNLFNNKLTNSRIFAQCSSVQSIDKLHKNIDAIEYKHIVLRLIFLKYISDAFKELYVRLKVEEEDAASTDPEDKDEYRVEKVFLMPQEACWSFLQSKAALSQISKFVDEAIDTIGKGNNSL